MLFEPLTEHRSIDLPLWKAQRTTAVLTLRGQRDLPTAGRASHSPGASASTSSVRHPALGPCLAPRRRAPSCAAACHTRALTPSWPRLAPVGATCCAMAQSVCRHASRPNTSPAGLSWPDLLHRRQESPGNRHHAWQQCKRQRSGKERSSWSGRFGSVLACGSAGRASNCARSRSQLPPGGQAHHVDALLYFAAVQGP
jgi:hypothetical protein